MPIRMGPRVKPEGDGFGMEDLLELVVVSKTVESRPDWSSRHVRIKYQMLLSAIFVYCVAKFPISEINTFGVVKFKTVSSEKSLISPEAVFWVALSFAIFGMISFISRTVFERIPRSQSEADEFIHSNLYYSDLKTVNRLIKKIEDSRNNSRLDHLMGSALDVVAGNSESPFNFRASFESKEAEEYLDLIVVKVIDTKANYKKFYELKEDYSKDILLHTLDVFENVQKEAVKLRDFVRNLPGLEQDPEVGLDEESEVLTEKFYTIFGGLKINHQQLYSDIKLQRRQANRSKLTTDFEILLLSVLLPVLVTFSILVFSIYIFVSPFSKLVEP